MNVKVIKRCDYLTTKWSGGDTTELYIYPEDGNYDERKFLFRLSTATITSEKSVFTQLKDISRQLMVLSGEMILEHEGKYSKVLKEFEQDSFMGEWKTISYGKVVDFNLMTSKSCIGNLKNIRVMSNHSINLTLSSKENNRVLKALYPVNKSMNVLLEEEKIEVAEKNLLLIELDKNDVDSSITVINDNGILNLIEAEVVYD